MITLIREGQVPRALAELLVHVTGTLMMTFAGIATVTLLMS